MSVYQLDYTEKSIAVFGQTTPLKDHLSKIGGKFNPGLTNKRTGNREPGWIFVKSKSSEVQTLLDSFINGTIQPLEPKTETDSSKQSAKEVPKSSFVFTKEMYLALVSRIEKLENDNEHMLRILQRSSSTSAASIESSKPPRTIKKKQIDECESNDEVEEESAPKKSFLKFN